jgi:predicted nicotinamide N-methyase
MSSRSTPPRIEERVAAVDEIVAAPDPGALARLLDEYTDFGPAPLVPEVRVFQGRVLLELWAAAERLAGRVMPPPYWAYPWPAGIALARLILDRPELVAGRRVLDLGTGGGITALASVLASAREVIANDQDPWAITTAGLAAARQDLELTLLQAELTTGFPGAPFVLGPDDLILCGDLYYERRVAPRIRAYLELARNSGVLVLAADAGRAYFDPTGFTLQSEIMVPVPRDLEGADERMARVYSLD